MHKDKLFWENLFEKKQRNGSQKVGKNIQTAGYNGSHTVGLHFANILEQVLSKLSASWLLGTQSYCTTIFANQIRSGDTRTT